MSHYSNVATTVRRAACAPKQPSLPVLVASITNSSTLSSLTHPVPLAHAHAHAHAHARAHPPTHTHTHTRTRARTHTHTHTHTTTTSFRGRFASSPPIRRHRISWAHTFQLLALSFSQRAFFPHSSTPPTILSLSDTCIVRSVISSWRGESDAASATPPTMDAAMSATMHAVNAIVEIFESLRIWRCVDPTLFLSALLASSRGFVLHKKSRESYRNILAPDLARGCKRPETNAGTTQHMRWGLGQGRKVDPKPPD